MTTNLKYPDFRSMLREAFQQRRDKNERYSLRAFARDIGLSLARTSEILNRNDAGLSTASAEKIAASLRWSQAKSKYFMALVARDHGRSATARVTAREHLQDRETAAAFQAVDQKRMDLLAKWFYVPILEIATLFEGRIDAELIARLLDLESSDSVKALADLVQAGFLVKSANRFRKSKALLRIESPSPSASIRNFHRQILKRASEAIEIQSMAERKLNSSVFTIRKADLDEAWNDIQAFERAFLAKFASPDNEGADAVYVMANQLFKLAERN